MQELNQDDHHEVPGMRNKYAETENLDINLLKNKLITHPDPLPNNKLLFIEGSSSYTIELVLQMSFPRRKTVLIIDNGPASLRLRRIASYLNIQHIVISLSSDPDEMAFEKIRNTIRTNPRITGILMAYTSFDEHSENEWFISQIAQKYDKLLICDNTLLNSAKPGLESLHFDYLISTLPLNLLGGEIFSYILANPHRLQRLKRAARNIASGPV